MPRRGRGGRFVSSRMSSARRSYRRVSRRARSFTRRAPSRVSKFVAFRRKVGFGGGSQIGSKVVAGELVAAAAIEPFVAQVDQSVPDGNIAAQVAEVFASQSAGEAAQHAQLALSYYPRAVRASIGNQLLDIGAAGFVRGIGRIFGV